MLRGFNGRIRKRALPPNWNICVGTSHWYCWLGLSCPIFTRVMNNIWIHQEHSRYEQHISPFTRSIAINSVTDRYDLVQWCTRNETKSISRLENFEKNSDLNFKRRVENYQLKVNYRLRIRHLFQKSRKGPIFATFYHPTLRFPLIVERP